MIAKRVQIHRAFWAHSIPSVALTVVAATFQPVALAQDASRLGIELTAVGAEVAASSSGIPAWTDPQPAGAGWSYGQKRSDFFVYKDDAPMYSIDASNVDQYASKLNPGQLEVIKQLKGYRMDVYPTRRTCGIPDIVAQNTKKNVGFAALAVDGYALANANTPGVPFPLPENGVQAMWNNKLRYRGIALEASGHVTAVSPRQGSDTWIKASSNALLFYPWALKSGTTFEQAGGIEGSIYFAYSSPAALAGQAGVITTNARDQEAFYYFPGQRRTRRMPSYAYDAPQIGFENQLTVDEAYVFSGSLDRFDWKLVGKQEMLVPYNTFDVYDSALKFEDMAQRDFVNPKRLRYELHRVWVVEATVRAGTRHSAPRRLFYLDEDSWNLVGAVDFDAQGQVWKVREGYTMPVYETGSCDAPGMSQFNVADRRYIYENHANSAPKDFRWYTESGNDPRLRPDYFTADNLRAISER